MPRTVQRCLGDIATFPFPIPPIEPGVVGVRFGFGQDILRGDLGPDLSAAGLGFGFPFFRRHCRFPRFDTGGDFVDLGGVAAFAEILPAVLALGLVFDPIVFDAGFELAEIAIRLRDADIAAFGVFAGLGFERAAAFGAGFETAVDFGLGLGVELDAFEGGDGVRRGLVRGELALGGGAAGDDCLTVVVLASAPAAVPGRPSPRPSPASGRGGLAAAAAAVALVLK
ncbi:MAG TPA: hypothetical protein VLK25_05265 [Allosphingosinicella sp.]|nr:hypothetical protein [Allosphingosinicella sp.]